MEYIDKYGYNILDGHFVFNENDRDKIHLVVKKGNDYFLDNTNKSNSLSKFSTKEFWEVFNYSFIKYLFEEYIIHENKMYLYFVINRMKALKRAE